MFFSRRLFLRGCGVGAAGAVAVAGMGVHLGRNDRLSAMQESAPDRDVLEKILAGVETIKADLGIRNAKGLVKAPITGAAAKVGEEPFSAVSATATIKKNPRVLVLFDVDGTLTPARKTMGPEMRAYLAKLREKVTVGVIGGSDFVKQKEQLGETVLEDFDFSFSENGLVAYEKGALLAKASIADHLGEAAIKNIVNWVMGYMCKIDCPVKRGTFIEFRTGMFNISPVGRNCSREERNAFEAYDHVHKVRETMVNAMREEFQGRYDLTYSVGGQISFDVFPTGWDKTYCLRFVDEKDFDEVHFFGDKTYKGGNDYEIFVHPRTIGHTVKNPEDTLSQLKELFGE